MGQRNMPWSKDMASPEKILTREQLIEIVPISRSQLYRLEQQGKFPRRVRLGANRVGWLASEVMAWIAEKAEARPN